MKKQQRYRTSEQDLYGIARVAWNNCLQYVGEFNQLSPRYTKAFIHIRLAEIDEAIKIPSLPVRKSSTETDRIRLCALAKDGLLQWRLLKCYIIEAFSKEIRPAMLNAAGRSLYSKAANQNWESLSSMLSVASVFINKNYEALTADDNMPQTFPGKFNTVKKRFTNALKAFHKKKGDMPEGTSIKTKANNRVYRHLRTMMSAGQFIFREQEAIKNLFLLKSVWAVVSDSNHAGSRKNSVILNAKC